MCSCRRPPTDVSRFCGLLLVLAACTVVGSEYECHSCFASCTLKADARSLTSKECDCVGNQTCHDQYCFTKVELWRTEEVITVLKGCRNEAPGGQMGCNYAGTDQQINCYCTGDLCNTVENFKAYSVEKLPLVECCECDYKKHDCNLEDCKHKCTGNYCYLDFEANIQGCGWGFPRLWEFARSKDFVRMEQDEATCLKYTVGHRRPVIGCTCTTKGLCNRYEKMKKADDRREATKFDERSHACYSISVPNQVEMPAAKIFENSTQCTGQYCYITLLTSETGLDYDQNTYYVSEYDTFDDFGEYGSNGPRGQDYQDQYGNSGTSYIARQTKKYTINAGCMSMGAHPVGKVSLGCYEELQADGKEPLQKHCICQSHLCNYIFAVSTDYDQLKLLPPPRRRPGSRQDTTVANIEEEKTEKPTTTVLATITPKLTTKSAEEHDKGFETVEINIPLFPAHVLPTLPPTTTTRQPPNTTPWRGGWEEDTGPFSREFSSEPVYTYRTRGPPATDEPVRYYPKSSSYSDENFGKVTVSLSEEHDESNYRNPEIVRDNDLMWPTRRPPIPPPHPPYNTDYHHPILTKSVAAQRCSLALLIIARFF